MGFANELKNQTAGGDWDAAVNHPFVDQLLDGSLSDENLRRYLVQDYQFCDAFTALLGQAVASAPSLPSRLVFARVLGAFASDENTYFQDFFNELDVLEADRTAPALGSATRDFDNLMRSALATRSYRKSWQCCWLPSGSTETGLPAPGTPKNGPPTQSMPSGSASTTTRSTTHG